MIGRRKRPVLPSSSHAEASEPSPSEFNDNRDEDERLHHSMQQALAFVGNILRDYTSPETQQARLAHLIRSTPSHLRPGAMRSETYDSMLSYLSRLKEKEVRSNATALMRQQISASSEPEPTSPVVQDELMKIVRSGKIEFKFVQLSHQPHFIRDLPGFYESLRPGQRHLPIVLRVLVKENTPRYVEVVDKSLLADLGWQYSFKTETWRQNMVNQDKLSGDVIYQREITGHITKMWEVTDADSDWRFGAFKEAERERIEKRKVKIEEREEEMLSVEE